MLYKVVVLLYPILSFLLLLLQTFLFFSLFLQLSLPLDNSVPVDHSVATKFPIMLIYLFLLACELFYSLLFFLLPFSLTPQSDLDLVFTVTQILFLLLTRVHTTLSGFHTHPHLNQFNPLLLILKIFIRFPISQFFQLEVV